MCIIYYSSDIHRLWLHLAVILFDFEPNNYKPSEKGLKLFTKTYLS